MVNLIIASLQSVSKACGRLCTLEPPPAVQTDVSDRGSEGGPGGRDPVPAEGDGERDGEKDLSNRRLDWLLFSSPFRFSALQIDKNFVQVHLLQ